MNKSIISILVLILLIPITFAELQLNPVSYDGSTYVDVEKRAELTLKNTFDFTIYDIQFTDMEHTHVPTISQMQPNETVKINITVKTNQTFDKKSFNAVVKFWYNSEINLDPELYKINITDAAMNPSTITIKKGDRIEWTNKGTYSAIIQDDNQEYFFHTIGVNQSIEFSNFNKVDDFTYSDLNDLTKIGRIIVEEPSEELVNNPEYNKIFTISYDSRYLESSLGIEIYPEPNLTMEYNEAQEVNIRVWNPGNQTAYDLEFSADKHQSWFTFEEQNIDLTKNQNEFLDLRIIPDINTSEETNKTYSIKIKVTSENAGTKEVELKIFIPFSEDIRKIYYGDSFWSERESFCNKFPNAIECNPPPKIEIVKEYVKLNSSIEFDKEDAQKNFKQINTKLSSSDANLAKLTKSLNEHVIPFIDKIIEANKNLEIKVNESNRIAEESRNKADEGMLNFTLMIFLILFILTGGLVIFYLKRRNKGLETQNNM